MKPYAKTQTVQPQIATPIPAGQEVQTVENVEKAFPEDLRELLNFEDKDEYVAIKPRAFLGGGELRKNRRHRKKKHACMHRQLPTRTKLDRKFSLHQQEGTCFLTW
jgi:hypothetical protein